jgi:glycosyltransferase involved in cell wall biosynthesis
LKVLLINWRDMQHPEAGGAEVHAHEIFRRLAARGHEITCLTCAWPGCEKVASLDGMRIVRTGSNHTFNYTVAGMLRAGLHRRLGADIVVEDLNKLPFFTPYAVKIPRLLLVHHFFGPTIFREAAFPIASYVWLWEKLTPKNYRNEYTQSVSQDTTGELVRMGFNPAKIRTIYNAVDSEAFCPRVEKEKPPFSYPYILYMGRVK